MVCVLIFVLLRINVELKKKIINGKEYCIDKFDIYVYKGIFVYFNE